MSGREIEEMGKGEGRRKKGDKRASDMVAIDEILCMCGWMDVSMSDVWWCKSFYS